MYSLDLNNLIYFHFFIYERTLISYNVYSRTEKKFLYFFIAKKFLMLKFFLCYFNKIINNCLFTNSNVLHIYLNPNLYKNFFIVVNFLKNNFLLDTCFLLDISCIDNFRIKSKKRFTIFYMFLSTLNNFRIFLHCSFNFFETVNSISHLFSSALWLEREIWDMFGIVFDNPASNVRILTDYGFKGYPLLKDFPLTGYVELRYDDVYKVILAEPVELSEEYRFFKLNLPWKKL